MKKPHQTQIEFLQGSERIKAIKNKKRGPKPRHGKGQPCIRKSLSIPEELWEWCESRALLRGSSVSEYIVMTLQRRRTWLKTMRGNK